MVIQLVCIRIFDESGPITVLKTERITSISVGTII